MAKYTSPRRMAGRALVSRWLVKAAKSSGSNRQTRSQPDCPALTWILPWFRPKLIFRYDNADHHPQIAAFPHHKHDSREANVIPSSPPALADVLREIEGLVDKATSSL